MTQSWLKTVNKINRQKTPSQYHTPAFSQLQPQQDQ